MQSATKPVDIHRLKADLTAAGVELLSAQCAIDRVRLQYSLEDIVTFGERNTLLRAKASAEAVCRFVSQLEAHMDRKNGHRR